MKVEYAKTRSGLRLSNIQLTLRKQKSSKKNARPNFKIKQKFESHMLPKNLAKFYNKSKSLCFFDCPKIFVSFKCTEIKLNQEKLVNFCKIQIE